MEASAMISETAKSEIAASPVLRNKVAAGSVASQVLYGGGAPPVVNRGGGGGGSGGGQSGGGGSQSGGTSGNNGPDDQTASGPEDLGAAGQTRGQSDGGVWLPPERRTRE